jgi:hypothetical protein
LVSFWFCFCKFIFPQLFVHQTSIFKHNDSTKSWIISWSQEINKLDIRAIQSYSIMLLHLADDLLAMPLTLKQAILFAQFPFPNRQTG